MKQRNALDRKEESSSAVALSPLSAGFFHEKKENGPEQARSRPAPSELTLDQKLFVAQLGDVRSEIAYELARQGGYGRVLAKAGNHQEAIQWYQQIKDHTAFGFVWLHHMLTSYIALAKDSEDSKIKSCMKKISQERPPAGLPYEFKALYSGGESRLSYIEDQAALLFDNGLLHHKERKLEAAEQYFHKALRLNPRLVDAHHNLAHLYREKKGNSLEKQQYHVLAKSHLEQILFSLDPHSLQARAMLVETYIALKHYEWAKYCFEGKKEFLIGPGLLLNALIGKLYAEHLKDYKAARPYYESAQASDATNTVLINLGKVYYELKEAQLAKKTYEEVLRQTEDSKDESGLRVRALVYNGLGALYGLTNPKNHQEAKQCHEQVVAVYEELLKTSDEQALDEEVSKELAQAHNNLGNDYFDLREYDFAQAHYDRALELDDRLAIAKVGRGNVYRHLSFKRSDDVESQHRLLAWAESQYQQALTLDPHLSIAYVGLGNINRQWGDYSTAKENYEKALELDEQKADVWGNLGDISIVMKDFKLAQDFYKRAIELDSELSMAYLGLGTAQLFFKNYEEAERYYLSAIKLYDSSELLVQSHKRPSYYRATQRGTEAYISYLRFEQHSVDRMGSLSVILRSPSAAKEAMRYLYQEESLAALKLIYPKLIYYAKEISEAVSQEYKLLTGNPYDLSINDIACSPADALDPRDDFEPLGKGGYGTVYKGYYQGKPVALKTARYDGFCYKIRTDAFFQNGDFQKEKMAAALASLEAKESKQISGSLHSTFLQPFIISPSQDGEGWRIDWRNLSSHYGYKRDKDSEGFYDFFYRLSAQYEVRRVDQKEELPEVGDPRPIYLYPASCPQSYIFCLGESLVEGNIPQFESSDYSSRAWIQQFLAYLTSSLLRDDSPSIQSVIRQYLTFFQRKALQDFAKEAGYLQEIVAKGQPGDGHEYIITYLGVCLESRFPYLVMAYAEHGTLLAYLKANGLFDTESSAYLSVQEKMCVLLYQVALGLAYLHAQGYVHLDLKCANVLVDEKEQVKITDFGLSIMRQGEKTSEKGGTPGWTSPEMSGPEPYDPVKADIYSLGCLIEELLTKKGGLEKKESNPLRDNLPADLLRIRDECVDPSPSKRPSLSVLKKRLSKAKNDAKSRRKEHEKCQAFLGKIRQNHAKTGQEVKSETQIKGQTISSGFF